MLAWIPQRADEVLFRCFGNCGRFHSWSALRQPSRLLGVRFLGWLGFLCRVFQVEGVTYPGPAVFQCPGPVVDVILGILGRVVAYPVPDLES